MSTKAALTGKHSIRRIWCVHGVLVAFYGYSCVFSRPAQPATDMGRVDSAQCRQPVLLHHHLTQVAVGTIVSIGSSQRRRCLLIASRECVVLSVHAS
jgi:hypothetical protein